MIYPTGRDAARAVARLMQLSQRLDERVVVESTPDPSEPDYEMQTAAFFLLHLLRMEGVIYHLTDNSLGFARHKVLSSSSSARLAQLEAAMDTYAASPRAAATVEAQPGRRAFSLRAMASAARTLAALLSHLRTIPP